MRGTLLAAAAVTGYVVAQLATPARLSAAGWAALLLTAALAVAGDVVRRQRLAVPVVVLPAPDAPNSAPAG